MLLHTYTFESSSISVIHIVGLCVGVGPQDDDSLELLPAHYSPFSLPTASIHAALSTHSYKQTNKQIS